MAGIRDCESMNDGTFGHFSDDQCIALLGESGVARVALSRHALPVIDPVHYRLAGDVLVMEGERLGTIAMSARDRHVVCFETEGLSGDGSEHWVVQITGPLGADGEHQTLDLATAMISGRVWSK